MLLDYSMKSFFHSLFEVLETVLIAAVVVIAFRGFIGQPFLVDGSSMEPSFHDADYLLIDQLTYRFRKPARGESVVFLYPKDPQKETYYIKRIVGLPGERVQVVENKVIITRDGESIKLDESYLGQGLPGSSIGADVILKSGEYFVVGDNRGASYDSRSWGPLKKEFIVGLVRVRLWPVSNIRIFHPPAYESLAASGGS